MVDIPVIDAVAARSTTWRKVVDEKEEGELKGIGVTNANKDYYFVKIKLDGELIVSNKLSSSWGEYGNNGMSIDLPFEDRIEVWIRDRHTPSTAPRFWISYLLRI